MKLRKTLFFEIPSKDFILPVYTEEDINTLKSFIDEEEVLFSVGYKSQEDEDGYYYIGQVKDFTTKFKMVDFPLVMRKRVLDALQTLSSNQREIDLNLEKIVIQYIIAYIMTRKGLRVNVLPYTEKNLARLKKVGIEDYSIKEEEVMVHTNSFSKDVLLEEEVFYRIKNYNY